MNKYQIRMDAAFKKMEAIRKKAEAENRALTAEELQERANLKAEIEVAQREWDDFKAEEELRANLYGGNGGGALTLEDPNHHVEIPDQPIYRGSPATMLGAQLLDIRTTSKPDAFHDREVSGSRSRLEQSQKRYIKRMETLAEKEGRAAATGGFTIGVPTDGGFFLQGETVVDLMTTGFNNSEILPRTSKRTLTATQFVAIS